MNCSHEYWWTDSADCEWDTPEEEEAYSKRGQFWRSAFKHFCTYVPAHMGLSYEFFSRSDVLHFGGLLAMEYEGYLKRGGR